MRCDNTQNTHIELQQLNKISRRNFGRQTFRMAAKQIQQIHASEVANILDLDKCIVACALVCVSHVRKNNIIPLNIALDDERTSARGASCCELSFNVMYQIDVFSYLSLTHIYIYIYLLLATACTYGANDEDGTIQYVINNE